ncbi:hypothetical protein BSFA1_49850 [Burkholderia sp. SFA1]|uniref:hypothetical protein n=1 Tax=Caballeronia sp. CLC5 TaxID=2906764 RepID=UPI001F47413B|nr:hypothetical protein [Caballeronia sp. CLC5]MCE4574473.1 hypothetical protein [Caballeronia sp. CLC5]BBP99856.1 hypothetical protein BSFA1_49850 [Burkholderia sp. SFA1]
MSNGIRLANRSLTLYRRRDVHFTNEAEEQRAAESAKRFLADSISWQYDSAFMSQLRELLGLTEVEPADARWKVQRALETGELVTMPDTPSSGLHGSGGSDMPRPRSITFTPSQLFKGAPRMASSIRSFAAPTIPRLPADDFFEIMAAKPGDVLPDGRVATPFTPEVLDASEVEALRQRVFGNNILDGFAGDAGYDGSGSLLGDVQPLEYQPDVLSDDVFELTAKTNNPRFAAKMLGYDENTFSDMLHEFKPRNGLGPADNVIFYDDGSVEFKKRILDDNIHDYAP